MSYIPQIINRTVGEVEILDLKGDFVGPWALRGREDIHRFIEANKPENLLINLKDVETIDSLGVKAVMDNLGFGMKGGVVSSNYSLLEMFSELMHQEKGIQFFKGEDEVVRFFGEELVRERTISTIAEKRKFTRLKSAFPIEFSYTDRNGERIVFRAIVTNISEGGLYAEYLDLEPSSGNPKKLDLYDFKMLEIKIKIPDKTEIRMEGKALRTDLEGEQMGIAIQFYRLSEEDKRRLQKLIS